MPESDTSPGPDEASRDTISFLLLLASVLTLGWALNIRVGFYDPKAIAVYGVSFIFCMLALFRPKFPLLVQGVRGKEKKLTGVVLGTFWLLTLTTPPLIYLLPEFTDEQLNFFPISVGILGFLMGVSLLRRPIFGKAHGWVLLAAFGVLGGWCIYNTPNPHIDTYPMAQEALAALVKGENPYAITFPDLYGNEVGSLFGYPPGFSANGRVLMGYSYPPLTLLAGLPSYLITGDHRYVFVAAIFAIAGFLYFLGRSTTHGIIAAVLLLSFPRLYAIMESAWTEPVVLVPLAATVWCAVKGKTRALPWVFGLFLCSKQHMILFAPAALWLMPRPLNWKQVAIFYAKALGIGAAVTLPFVLWSFKAFWHSVIEIQLVYRARPDALSFPSFFFAQGMKPPPRFLSLALLPVVYAIAWWRVPRSVFGFALTLASAAFATLAFDQAFLNRNFFVYTAMLLALGALPYRTPEPLPAKNTVEPTPAAG